MVEREYTVRLQRVFQGPLDLLLHLVREQEVEIHEVDISRILDDYLGYLGTLEALDIEVAGDFLVMAATLMAIKSRSLLPGEQVDLEHELDPRDELIQRLLEYRKFREAAEGLEAAYRERSSQSERGFREAGALGPDKEFDLGELSVWDVFAVFSRLMRETLADRPHHVPRDARPLRFYVDRMIDQLQRLGPRTLRQLVSSFERVPQREALIGSFCALLELVRLELVDLRHEAGSEEFLLEIRAGSVEDLEEILRRNLPEEEPPPGTPRPVGSSSSAPDLPQEPSPGAPDR